MNANLIDSLKGESLAVLLQYLLKVLAETFHHHEPVLLVVVLKGAGPKELRHAEALQSLLLPPSLNVLRPGQPHVAVHLGKQRPVAVWLNLDDILGTSAHWPLGVVRGQVDFPKATHTCSNIIIPYLLKDQEQL